MPDDGYRHHGSAAAFTSYNLVVHEQEEQELMRVADYYPLVLPGQHLSANKGRATGMALVDFGERTINPGFSRGFLA